MRTFALLLFALSAAAESRFLVRFGLDGKPDVDWSGSLSAPQFRLSTWQFDRKADQLNGSSWKCTTRNQTYWDTPYERVMGPTSRRSRGISEWIRKRSRGGTRTRSIASRFSDFRRASLT